MKHVSYFVLIAVGGRHCHICHFKTLRCVVLHQKKKKMHECPKKRCDLEGSMCCNTDFVYFSALMLQSQKCKRAFFFQSHPFSLKCFAFPLNYTHMTQ